MFLVCQAVFALLLLFLLLLRHFVLDSATLRDPAIVIQSVLVLLAGHLEQSYQRKIQPKIRVKEKTHFLINQRRYDI